METATWARLLLGALLLHGTQGFLFGRHHQRHESSHEQHETKEESSSKKDPYRNPLKAEYFCQGPCMDGWVSYMGLCHRYVLEKKTWSEGETFCKNAFSRAHLTSIEDDEHGTFLTTLARSKDTNVGPFWTGASDSKGHTFWLLGSKKCKSLGFMGLGLLGDNNCNTRLPFVCMYKPKIYP